jgi:hypothetical protein
MSSWLVFLPGPIVEGSPSVELCAFERWRRSKLISFVAHSIGFVKARPRVLKLTRAEVPARSGTPVRYATAWPLLARQISENREVSRVRKITISAELNDHGGAVDSRALFRLRGEHIAVMS